MGHTDDILNDIRGQIDAQPEPLEEARRRLGLVRSIADRFPGARRTYASGSLAQHTFIHPVSDGDGGVVLNRRFYPELGPDGDGETPSRITTELCALLGPEVRKLYPGARCGTSKRGPKLSFARPVNEQDPTVDLVVALTRREASGLWIPNLETNTWEASDPEKHVDLFTSGSESVKRTRRRVVRLLKAWNKQWAEPGFSSHNLTVWAWEFINPGMGMATALSTVFSCAAARVSSGAATYDPAGVSPNVRLLVSRSRAERRLRGAAEGLAEALEHDDDLDTVLKALSKVYRSYLASPTGLAGKIAPMRDAVPLSIGMVGLAGPAAAIPGTPAYGDEDSTQ
ncbi:hypothetical protein J7E87_18905 [Streptomyces sp. ISL-1]|uniref:hypothetical protein n=1 Tax=Streptomyces sp. ISL-1 TaxID=2817657 RepID=UPI001BE71DCD|nr:hypothetical protein [Streptomyces sp. ISL-1]MBT2391449.1 hypothetical protein [Streptomyces sp. ISL-1]